MSSKKKLKIKKRRQLSSEEFHGNRLRRIMDYRITQAFPDPKEKQEYIQALLKGLGD